MDIGSTIKDLRKRKNLSQKDLADKSGISQTYLSQLERGERQRPTIEILRKISESLELPYPVIEFLAIDFNSIESEKLNSYKRVEKSIHALINDLFFKKEKRKRN